MPAIRLGNTYPVVLVAGIAQQSVAPAQDKRVCLFIQNTGANPCTYQWGKPVTGDLTKGEFQLVSGELHRYDNICPIENLSLYSTLGTTVTIYEGIS